MKMDFKNYIEPPGTFIKEEIDARGWSQRDLAYILGIDEQSVSTIISGNRGISAEKAKALGAAFDVPAEFFTNLQNAYDLSCANDPNPGVAKRGRVQSHYPLREMIKRQWIEDSEPIVLEAQLSRFFEVDSIDEVPHLAHAAKRSNHYDDIPPVQLAWLFRVRQLAKTMIVPKYSPEALRNAIKKMRSMRSSPEEIRHVPRLLQGCGVRFALVEKLPGGKIDGVCFWFDKSSPVIGMSLLRDRIDNFWFVLIHEIEHVLLKHGQKKEIIDVDLTPLQDTCSDEERLANEASAEFCVSQKKMDSFYTRKAPFFSEKNVIAFAELMETHPGIIVGQIQRRTKRWNFLRKHQVNIQHHLLPSAYVDGWGDVAPVEL